MKDEPTKKRNANEPSSRISHPAKFANNQYVSHTCQAVTRVSAYVPPCDIIPAIRGQTPWHPLAQSRATAGNLKQLRVRRGYVRCTSWKTREEKNRSNETNLSLSENPSVLYFCFVPLSSGRVPRDLSSIYFDLIF